MTKRDGLITMEVDGQPLMIRWWNSSRDEELDAHQQLQELRAHVRSSLQTQLDRCEPRLDSIERDLALDMLMAEF